MVTLWPVDEVSTILFMVRFYTNLRNGLSKAAALRDAQNYLRQLSKATATSRLKELGFDNVPLPPGASHEPVFAHPYFWAPFVLMGDDVAGVAPEQPSVARPAGAGGVWRGVAVGVDGRPPDGLGMGVQQGSGLTPAVTSGVCSTRRWCPWCG